MLIDKEYLDSLISEAKESPRLRMNRNLHESLDSKAQRLFNALLPGTELPVHRHMHTAETYILMTGHITVYFYDDSGNVTKSFELKMSNGNLGVHIPKGQWHTLTIHEPSVIFEVKDGPYTPLSPQDLLVKQ